MRRKNFCKAVLQPLCTAITEEEQSRCVFYHQGMNSISKRPVCNYLGAKAICNSSGARHKIAPYTLKVFLRNKPFREKIVFEGVEYQILSVCLQENKCLVETRFKNPTPFGEKYSYRKFTFLELMGAYWKRTGEKCAVSLWDW